MKKLMIYGATGYTGRMAAQHAAAAGTPLILAGRNEAALASLAASLGVQYRVFALDDETAIDGALHGVAVLLNCAGPFAGTAGILMRAGIRHGVHYLDVAAELDGYRLAEVLDAEASAAGVMLLPGSGGSVAMLGCLAGHTVARSSQPASIRVAMHVTGGVSRGSAVSAVASVTAATLARADGALVAQARERLRRRRRAGPVCSRCGDRRCLGGRRLRRRRWHTPVYRTVFRRLPHRYPAAVAGAAGRFFSHRPC